MVSVSVRFVFVVVCAGSMLIFLAQQYAPQDFYVPRLPEKLYEKTQIEEMDSLIDKLKVLVQHLETKLGGNDVGSTIAEGPMLLERLQPPEPPLKQETGLRIEDAILLKRSNQSLRIWIDVPSDFPWRKCVLNYNGAAATNDCNLHKDPIQSWLIAPLSTSSPSTPSPPLTPSYRIINTNNRCLEPPPAPARGYSLNLGKGTEEVALTVKECTSGSWKHLPSGHLEWSGGGCATALGTANGGKISLSPCDTSLHSQRFEFGFYDEEKVEISPLDRKDWEQRQKSLRDDELEKSVAEFRLSMKDTVEDTVGDGKDNKTANMSRRAAVFYLDNGSDAAYVKWWVLAWKLLGLNSAAERFDLVLFVHPKMLPRLLGSDCSEYKDGVTALEGPGKCLYVPLVGIAERDANYDKYINSHECLVNQKAHFLRQYSHLMRSDLDTFPAPALVGNWPDMIIANRFMGYDFKNSSGESKITEAIEDAMLYLGQKHKGWHDIGSTWFGPSHRILKLSKLTFALSRYLRFYMFGPGTVCRCATCTKLPAECQWGAGPYAGTLLLYAQEIAMNLVWSQEEYDAMKEGHVDMGTTGPESVCPKLQLHIFHSEENFSKFKFSRKEYKNFDMKDLDPSKTSDYAVYLALKSANQGINVEVVDNKYSLGKEGSLVKICQNYSEPESPPNPKTPDEPDDHEDPKTKKSVPDPF